MPLASYPDRAHLFSEENEKGAGTEAESKDTGCCFAFPSEETGQVVVHNTGMASGCRPLVALQTDMELVQQTAVESAAWANVPPLLDIVGIEEESERVVAGAVVAESDLPVYPEETPQGGAVGECSRSDHFAC